MAGDALEELKELNLLAQESDPEKRRQLLHRTTDLFLGQPASFTELQGQFFGDIIERLAYDLESQVREELARRVAPEAEAPYKLIRRLAEDEIAVAQPVLEKSPALTQSDLIDIGESGSQQHLLALTKRSDIDDGLSAVLVRRSDDEVVESLLRNETAKISPETHSDIAQRAKGSEPLQSAMGRRTDVPREIMVGLFKHVSDKVRLEIKEKLTEADQKALDQVVDTMKADIEEIEATTAEQHVAELARSGALNQRVLVEFARNDKPTEFLLALAMLIKVDVATTQRLLAEETGRALAVACRASDISFDAFKTVILSPFSAAPSDLHEVMPLLRSYNQLNEKAARSTMRSWRMRKGTPEDPEQTVEPSKLAS